MAFKDEDGSPLVDKILRPPAGQKGTGKWTVINSLDMGHSDHAHGRGGFMPAAFRAFERTNAWKAARKLKGTAFRRSPASPRILKRKKAFINDIMSALYRLKNRQLRARVTCSCARRRRNTVGI